MSGDHRPVRTYYECGCIPPDALPEDLPEDVALQYEDEYYESHFAVLDDFDTCNKGFAAFVCAVCSAAQEDGEFIAWPCAAGDPSLPLPESGYPDPPEAPRAVTTAAS